MRGKAPLSESGSNGILLTDSYDESYREIFYIKQRFFHIGRVKISNFGKKVQLIWNL